MLPVFSPRSMATATSGVTVIISSVDFCRKLSSWSLAGSDDDLLAVFGHRDGNAIARGSAAFPFDEPQDFLAVGSYCMIAAVDDHLRRVDPTVPALGCVGALALGVLGRSERVPPADIVPVVDVERHGDDALSADEVAHEGVGRRAGGTALAGEELDDHGPPCCRGRPGER